MGVRGEQGELAALTQRILDLEAELAAAKKAAAEGNSSTPLAAREALLASAERHIHLGSWFYNLETLEVKWSEELYRILGFDSRTDKASLENWFQAIHPEDRQRALKDNEKFLDSPHVTTEEYRVKWKDGTVRLIRTDALIVRDANGKMLRVVGTVLDVTERRQMEEQLRQSHKMEAVGRLAAGVAHDFNNLLSVISGNADLLLESRPDEKLKRIRDAAEVGAALTRQLLAFSRQSVIRPVVLDLGEVVRDTVRIIERLIGENILVRLDLSSERCAVLADRAQIQQILLNLSINARDAMPGGGEIRIATAPAADPFAPPARGPSDATASGSWVRLTVEDTGSGMDEATRSRAFEPFFTTKEPGKGTGLGLYAVLDAVTQASGHIAMDSVPAKGTTVNILLPRKAFVPAAGGQAESDARGGVERILVVEDHPALRELVRCFLVDAGYQVHVVGRPGEAESLWDQEGGAIDLLITDLVMPEKSGRALAAGLLAQKPSLKTLFISGYAQGFGPEKKVEGPYLQKPFTRLELLRMVRSIFDGTAPSVPGRPAAAPAKGPSATESSDQWSPASSAPATSPASTAPKKGA
jgi:PAS domain S-box-containing protein